MRCFLLFAFLATTVTSVAQKKSITLEDIWRNGTFRIKTVPGFNALKDGKRYTQIDDENGSQQINVYDLQSGRKLNNVYDNAVASKGELAAINRYAFSDNEQKLLLFTEAQNIYRRSVLYRVYIYNTLTKEMQVLDSDKVLHASFSPDGSKVAFVKNNNLYFKDLTTGNTVTVTTDGRRNEIINGNCDWVYEEEFEFTQAYQWSPDGNSLAFYRFDESPVPEFTLLKYDSLYPRPYKYKYPKAGEPNSIVQIRFFHINSGKTITADIGPVTDQYIPRIKWTNDAAKLCIFRMNRHQNKLELLLADAATGASNIIYKEQNPYYIEINDNLSFLPDNASFIFNSERSGFNHFYRWNWKKQKLTALTSGNYDIDQLVGIDENKEMLYYTAAEGAPTERKLYAVNWKGKNKKTLTPENGTHDLTPIRGCQYFLDKYSTLQTPPVYYLRDGEGRVIRTLEDNAALKNKLQEYSLGKIRLLQVPGDSNVMLNAWMITPPAFDSTKKYPVLLYQYSGPGSQQVADRFPAGDFFWHQMLAEKGYVILCVDPTGTGFRGQQFKKKTYLQLGNLESNDHIAVAKYLATVPYVDKSRIGIWGWSYGGFMSSTCILKGHDVFKAAIAIAPVTNWRYYDNIYTERYMRTPEENPEGYDQNAPEKMADKLTGKFLVIHGTGDDNVHFQNEVMLVNALIAADRQFDSEFYPNRAHGIAGGITRFHLYRRMTDFILKNL